MDKNGTLNILAVIIKPLKLVRDILDTSRFFRLVATVKIFVRCLRLLR